MPTFAKKYNDAQIKALVSYLRRCGRCNRLEDLGVIEESSDVTPAHDWPP